MSTRHELLVDETVNTPRGTLQVKRVFTYSQNLPCDTGNQDEVFITELDSNNQPNGLKVSFKDSRGYRAPDKARFLCDVLPVTNGVLNGVGYRFSSDGGLRAINVWKNDEIIRRYDAQDLVKTGKIKEHPEDYNPKDIEKSKTEAKRMLQEADRQLNGALNINCRSGIGEAQIKRRIKNYKKYGSESKIAYRIHQVTDRIF